MLNQRTVLLLGILASFALAVPTASAQSRSKGTKAVVAEFPTGGSPTTADFLYFLGSKRALNLSLGLGVELRENQDTEISLAAIVGYRMYSSSPGKAMPYLEPFVGILLPDLGNGDTLGATAGARLGVEFPVFKQFTLGAYVAAALEGRNNFEELDIFTSTGAITAAFYWD